MQAGSDDAGDDKRCPGRPPDRPPGDGGGVSDAGSSCQDGGGDTGDDARCPGRPPDRLSVDWLVASLLQMLDSARVGIGSTEERVPTQLIRAWSADADALFRAQSAHIRGARRAVLRKRFGSHIGEALQIALGQRSVRDTATADFGGSPCSIAPPC